MKIRFWMRGDGQVEVFNDYTFYFRSGAFRHRDSLAPILGIEPAPESVLDLLFGPYADDPDSGVEKVDGGYKVEKGWL